MPTERCRVLFLPDGKEVRVRPGTTLLAAARSAGVRIPVRCEGKMGCLMCKVTLNSSEAGVLPPEEGERRKLGPALDRGIRLACQAKVCGEVTAETPEDPLKRAVRLQLEKAKGAKEDFWD
ncbi:2Fe-2S iron-sulfur cluster-binding protein [Saccharibacillus alkalitolerans]|uniref:2Fe-2S iron-sulfur cluster binding domain-containing protein n=1 Tax=Saccharibacillus alkalitolerans TaxID=2705290 RepID=A0ABX0F2Y9_9BACL|nr:2Fe-2S iron-sulfur cluster-binding protein [Saccharibacillus alkalitolerans]NGZ74235.1 2Fe-2S iron-sulfur cluster binding domain-containing protein [Saccharibacillus alkalitolerans]